MTLHDPFGVDGSLNPIHSFIQEVVMARIRLGHTRLTHEYLMKNEDPPICIGCDCRLTIKHILVDCVEFSHIRPGYFTVTSMKELFEKVTSDRILTYLKEIGLYNKI